MHIDTSAPVMLTGATGYVAGWVAKELLEAGVTVHAPVRNPDNTDKINHLQEMAAANPGDVHFFKADLLDQGSYAKAIAGCAVVIHTASPFTTTVDDPQRQLIDPAVKGTANVLQEAVKTPTVKRVVLTSSCAAIYGDAADCADAPGGVLTEEVWNTSSSLTNNPYSYSKTLAEKEAWQISKTQSQWDLAVLNPSLVMGPGTRFARDAESFRIMKRFGDGTMKAGAPRMGLAVVDVRDLAKAHVSAAFTKGANGRNIISGTSTDLVEMGRVLAETWGADYPIPTRAIPKPILWLVGPMFDPLFTRKLIARNINHPWRADTSKGMRELGIHYRPLKETLNDMFQQLVDHNLFRSAA